MFVHSTREMLRCLYCFQVFSLVVSYLQSFVPAPVLSTVAMKRNQGKSERETVVILSYLRNAILPKSCFRRLCHSNFVNTLLYITIFCTIPRLHRHRNLSQFLFKQSSASTSTTVAKISNKSLFELFFSGPSRENFCPFSAKNRLFEVDNGLRDDGLEYEQCVDNHPTWYFAAHHTIGDAASIVFG